jgi:Bacterial alpha-L-rhamnosidase C-terminal domain
MENISRRHFFKQSTLGATALSAFIENDTPLSISDDFEGNLVSIQTIPPFYTGETLDLAPAQWIWHPAQRTLPNTIFFFRKEVQIDKKVKQAKGWILGDSRYRLLLNGERLQFGPAPADPRYLQDLKSADGLLPVENIGVPYVWIDHDAYKKQRHKQCAFNLYAAASMEHAFAPLCRLFGEPILAKQAVLEGQNLLKKTKAKYWSNTEGVFINNLPWAKEEGEYRLCDRSLATAVIHNQVTDNQQFKLVEILSSVPKNLGISYPANAIWRHWALAKGQRMDVILQEFTTRWHDMPSVQLNNTLAEIWNHTPDNSSEWSHAPLSPMFILYMEIAGIKPIKAGYETVEIAPQLGDLQQVSLTNYTVRGAIKVNFEQTEKALKANIELPPTMTGVFKWKNEKRVLKSGKQSFQLT